MSDINNKHPKRRLDMINRVAVVGAGFMGSQIVFQFARHGVNVNLIDTNHGQLDKFLGVEAANSGDYLSGVVSLTNDLREGVVGCDLVLDCTPEDFNLKVELFKELVATCHPNTILATNSSAILVSELEEYVLHGQSYDLRQHWSEQLINMHFFPVVWERPLVEVCGSGNTSKDVLTKTCDFISLVELTPIVVQKEHRGFIVNYIWQTIKTAALGLVDQEVASPQGIDQAWKLATNMPAGPFELMDTVGLDIVAAVFKQHGQEVPRVLAQHLESGNLGKKSGRGFYAY
jgi:3-hydroxyacyl-CoA dehydrogenase